MPQKPIAMAIHGGAGTLRRDKLTDELEQAYRAELKHALDTGHGMLSGGGRALDAVAVAVCVLEDSPLFNAGRGSVLTRNGSVEMDAAIMSGEKRQAGAVTLITQVRHPILLAKAVLLHSEHVLLSGPGAEAFAQAQGLQLEDPEWFVTERRLAQLEHVRGSTQEAARVSEDIPAPDDHEYGTVGAVALDADGNLAAATSTGGLMNKREGRIGDSAIIGAGTYADNRAAAVSTTGHGESFIRSVAAHDVCARILYQGVSLRAAADAVIHEELESVSGHGGLIAVDPHGSVVFSLNTSGMYRAAIDGAGTTTIAIFAD